MPEMSAYCSVIGSLFQIYGDVVEEARLSILSFVLGTTGRFLEMDDVMILGSSGKLE